MGFEGNIGFGIGIIFCLLVNIFWNVFKEWLDDRIKINIKEVKDE